jgi:16S rRNA methyltransferase RsmB/F
VNATESQENICHARVSCGQRLQLWMQHFWSLSFCCRLQEKLIVAGMRALKPGGRLVYSTCSIFSAENDDVVLRAMERVPGTLAAVQLRTSDNDRICIRECGNALQMDSAAQQPSEFQVTSGTPQQIEATGSDDLAGNGLQPSVLLTGLDCILYEGMEPTKVGWMCLPDKTAHGPIYFAVIIKQCCACASGQKCSGYMIIIIIIITIMCIHAETGIRYQCLIQLNMFHHGMRLELVCSQQHRSPHYLWFIEVLSMRVALMPQDVAFTPCCCCPFTPVYCSNTRYSTTERLLDGVWNLSRT